MITQSVQPPTDPQHANHVAAERFIQAFNQDAWAAVRDVVADGFVFHHPIGGTVQAGPEGMVATWAGFKHLSPDSWHPIPILITEGDYAAVLPPTYGHFTGRSDQAPAPTAWRLDYGMVNMGLAPTGRTLDDTGLSMDRVEGGMIAEVWETRSTLGIMRQLDPRIGGGHHH
jgi:predicted SnoaL-like aldol condensation-catalyzing enzyme